MLMSMGYADVCVLSQGQCVMLFFCVIMMSMCYVDVYVLFWCLCVILMSMCYAGVLFNLINIMMFSVTSNHITEIANQI